MSEVSILIKAVDEATAVLKGVQNSISGLDTTGKKAGSETGGLAAFSKKAFFIGNAFGMIKDAVSGTIGTINRFTVSAAADMEQTTVAFEVLTGSADLAKQTIEDIQRLGASTPFQFPELADAGRKLLAFGSDASYVEDELRSIGDIASGIQAPIGEIAEIYGKARVQGRLFAEDINQLTGRGIPIIGEFAAMFGTTEANIKAMVTNGEIGFVELEQAFINMTSEGGKFNGMMEAQSQTFNGLVSTLKDNVEVQLTRIGAKIIETFDLKGALSGGIAFIENNMPLIESTIDTAFNAISTAIGMGKTAVSGFSEEWSIFWDGLQRIWNTGLKPLLIAIGPLFSAAFETAKIAISTLWEVANGVVESIVLLLEGDLSGAATAFFGVGKDLVQGLINGIGSMFTGIKESVTNLGTNILSWFKSAVGSQSPWKTTIIEGQNLLKGLLIGIQDIAIRNTMITELGKLGQELITATLDPYYRGMDKLNLKAEFLGTPLQNLKEQLSLTQTAFSDLLESSLADGVVSNLERENLQAFANDIALLTEKIDLLEDAATKANKAINLVFKPSSTFSPAPLTDSPIGMMPSLPSMGGGSNATPSNGIAGGTPTQAISMFIDKIVELLVEPLTTVSDAVTISLTPLAETSASVNVSILPLIDTLDAVDVTMSNYGATMATNLDISDQVTVSTQATLETIEATQETFSSFNDFVAKEFGALGTGLLSLGNQIPFFGAAFNAGLQEITNQAGETIGFLFDPIAALTSIFFDLVGQSKAFGELIRIVNVLLTPFIAAFDVLLPVVRLAGIIFAQVYNALATLVRVATFWLVRPEYIDMAEVLGIDNIQGGTPNGAAPEAPTAPEVTPPVTTSSPSISQPEFDIGRLPTAVQFAVFTPLVETLDKLSIVVERLVDEGIKVQLQSNSSSATQRFRAA